jgi:hypothetical protein
VAAEYRSFSWLGQLDIGNSELGTCRQELAFDRLVEGFIAAYGGRDTSLLPRILWWKARFADRSCTQITDDDVHAALLDLESTPALGYLERPPVNRAIR